MQTFDRRQFLKLAGLGAALLPFATRLAVAQDSSAEFKLPKLPYSFDALEPVIDKKTMEIHYGKHHQGYVDKLNTALKSVPSPGTLENILTHLDEMPEDIRTSVRNNAGGHYNHTLFWESMLPPGDRKPGERLHSAIEQSFGDLKSLQSRFQEAGGSLFGSGWVWLVWNAEKGALEVMTTPNQDNPLMIDSTLRPLLGNDCWEHAYYLQYQNRRADYLKAWWELVNWEVVDNRLHDHQTES